MLTRIQLENFKSWRKLDIELAPLTMLFGTNSSGKTSILQALLLLKQTAASFDRKQHINFGGSQRDYVDLGSYRDLVYGHEEKQNINVGLEWSPSNELLEYTSPDFIEVKTFGDKLQLGNLELSYQVRWQYLEDEIVIEQLQYSMPTPENFDVLVNAQRRDDGKYEYRFPLLKTRVKSDKSPESCYGIPSLAQITTGGKTSDVSFYQLNYNLLFENVINRVIYLGPLRRYPQRTYSWTGTGPQEIEPTGENTIGMLVASKRQSSNGQNLLAQVAAWLTKLGLVSEFQIEAVDRNKRLYEARVRVTNEGTVSSLLDVGFGISQVLPVVVMLLSAPEGSIVLVEQPELHLHPSAQSNLADFFLEVAEKRNLQLIIESHSEHLLRRLQRRIAEAETLFASPDNIKMYFCEKGVNGSTIQAVEVDSYGQIQNWPEGFFGDITGDLEKMAMAALQRPQNGS